MAKPILSLILGLSLAAALSCLAKPTLFIIGDSTVRNSTGGQMGWGDPLVAHFDPAKVEVINRAIGGRSSRTFLTEGRWDAVMAHLKPGDFVLMQFGHNDGGALNDERCRASIRGIGNETEEIVRKTDGKPEKVLTFGAYLKTYVRDAKAKGATPIIVSPIPRNIWKDGKVARSTGSHVQWAGEVAKETSSPFIDFHNLLADHYDSIGNDRTNGLFANGDHTHTGSLGAEFNAALLADAIRSLPDQKLADLLLPGDLFLPSVFSNHMVLQRGVKIPV